MGKGSILLLNLTVIFGVTACAASPEISVIASQQRDGYECRLVEFETDRDEIVRAYLLVPDIRGKEKLPAVLMLHDHGARFDIGKEKLARPLDAPDYIVRSSRQWVEKYFDGIWFADALASEGYVVLVTDALYWGDRSSPEARKWSRLVYGDPEGSDTGISGEERKRLKESVYEGQRHVHDSLSAAGVVWAGKILHDDMVSAEVLASLPFVDRDRIGAFGFSMGAHRCWLLSAFSDRVKCGAAVCWMTLKDAYDSDNASDLSMRIPSMRQEMDFPDIAVMLKPKPMLFLAGDSDPLFPEDAVLEAFEKMHSIYSGGTPAAAPALETEFFHGGHHCGKQVQATVSGFFRREL